MTDEQKRQIENYRKNGYGYKQISNLMSISLNTIKSFCRRNRLKDDDLQESTNQIFCCEQCGKSVEQKEHRKRKRFCSDACRNKWWNSHLDMVNRKANYEIICPCCKSTFYVYGNANRKYCSNECYLKYRFGGKKDE